jgi:hypothetical protein
MAPYWQLYFNKHVAFEITVTNFYVINIFGGGDVKFVPLYYSSIKKTVIENENACEEFSLVGYNTM